MEEETGNDPVEGRSERGSRTDRRSGPHKAADRLEAAIGEAIDALEHERDPIERSQIANRLIERCRVAEEEFAEQRTLGFTDLREILNWSLADISARFGISRPRAAQIINRQAYKDRREERK